jgi:molybdenum cofactor synthesis domain-containing protein
MFRAKLSYHQAKTSLLHFHSRYNGRFPRAVSLLTMTGGKAHSIHTSACLIIGDEVLNGKIQDTNSNYFAKYCFDLGIDMRRVTVVPDEETEIVESIRELSTKYDFVITSGGIGPTHDDITYESIAKAFNLPLELHKETVERMRRLGRVDFTKPGFEEARLAQLRMATLPTGTGVRYIYTSEDLWVPIVSIDNKVYICPGIPRLFKALLEGIRDEMEDRIRAQRYLRFYVATQWPESRMAPILSKLQARYTEKGIKIGSYPHMERGLNTVSVIGSSSEKELLQKIIKDLEISLEGQQVTAEEESQNSIESFFIKQQP